MDLSMVVKGELKPLLTFGANCTFYGIIYNLCRFEFHPRKHRPIDAYTSTGIYTHMMHEYTKTQVASMHAQARGPTHTRLHHFALSRALSPSLSPSLSLSSVNRRTELKESIRRRDGALLKGPEAPIAAASRHFATRPSQSPTNESCNSAATLVLFL